MKIVFVSNLYLPNIGGVETAVHRFGKILLKKGITIGIITSRFPQTLSKREIIDEISVLRLPFRVPTLKPFYSILMFLFRFLECITEIVFYNKGIKADIVHIHFPSENSIYAMFLSWISRAPLVTSIHGGEIETFANSNRLNWWVLHYTLMKSKFIITNSHYQAEKTKSTFPNIPALKYKVIPNSIEPPILLRNSPDPTCPGNFIIGIGRFDYIKGFDTLLYAFKLFNNKHPECNLVLVGDGIEEEKLKHISESLFLHDNVYFTGRVHNSKIFEYLACSSFLVLPSRQEAFGIVCLESMIMGKPVVAFNVGGVSEIVKNNFNGLLVENHTSEALAEKISELYASPSHILLFGQNGKKYVQMHFSSERIFVNYLDVFQSCTR